MIETKQSHTASHISFFSSQDLLSSFATDLLASYRHITQKKNISTSEIDVEDVKKKTRRTSLTIIVYEFD